MAASTPTYEELRRSLAARKYAPVYLLHCEEGFYTDVLVKEMERIVPEEDKDFNQHILYAPETTMDKVMDLCRTCPMMSERVVVILKEAQAIRADQLNRLHAYVKNPTPSTTLVICCRGAVAKGKELLAAMRTGNNVNFESKKVNENTAGTLIGQYIKSKGLNCDVKAVQMLRDFIGTDLSRLYNEIDKLATILPRGAAVTPEVVEIHVGVSKEYNSFELVDAIAAHDSLKVYRIADYFAANPKGNPLVMTCATLFGFFSDLLICQFSPDKSDSALMQELNLKNVYPLRRFRTAMANYNARKTIEIIGALRDFDRKSKGGGSRQNEHVLFRELLFHILTAPGDVAV